jgi:hypothetical protein
MPRLPLWFTRKRTPALPRRNPLAALGEHLALDTVNASVYWARARRGPDGLRLCAWGSLAIPPSQSEASVLRELARCTWVKCSRVEAPLRSPALRHRRVALPSMSAREAGSVAQRRLEEFLLEQSELSIGSAIRSPASGAHPAWLVAAPESTPEVFEARWRALGFELHRLASEPLALGNFARVLPALPDALTAVFDVNDEGGDCVVCDGEGWLFNRVIPLHRQGAGSESGSADSEESNRLQDERMITELRRTFQYVERELRLGAVQRLVLSGSHARLRALPAALEEALGVPTQLIGDAIEEGPARGMDPAAAHVVGLALAPHAHGCNLLPRATLAARRERRARLHSILALAASGALSLLAVAAHAAQTFAIHREGAAVQTRIESVAERTARAHETARIRERAHSMDQALAELRSHELPLASWLDALRRLAPPDIALDSLHAERAAGACTGTLVVVSRAKSVAGAAVLAAQFAQALGRIPLFTVTSVERSPDNSQLQDAAFATVQFRISGALRPLQPAERLPPADGAEPAVEGGASRG